MNVNILTDEELAKLANSITPEQAQVELNRRESLKAEQETLEKMEQDLLHLESYLETLLASFQSLKQQADFELNAWLGQGVAIIRGRKELLNSTYEIVNVVRELSRLKLVLGVVHSPLGEQDAIAGVSVDDLKRMTKELRLVRSDNVTIVRPQLLIRFTDNPTANELLSFLTGYTGDAILNDYSPGPLLSKVNGEFIAFNG